MPLISKRLLFPMVLISVPILVIGGLGWQKKVAAEAELSQAYAQAHRLGLYTDMEQIYRLAPPGADGGRKLLAWAKGVSPGLESAIERVKGASAPLAATDDLPNLAKEVLNNPAGWENDRALDGDSEMKLGLPVYGLTYRGTQLGITDPRLAEEPFELAHRLITVMRSSKLSSVRFVGEASELGLSRSVLDAILAHPEVDWSRLHKYLNPPAGSAQVGEEVKIDCAETMTALKSISLEEEKRGTRLWDWGNNRKKQYRLAKIETLRFYSEALRTLPSDRTGPEANAVWEPLLRKMLADERLRDVSSDLAMLISADAPFSLSTARVQMDLLPWYIETCKNGGRPPSGLSKARDSRGNPVKYLKQKLGFKIYSFGKNGKDDGGKADDPWIMTGNGYASSRNP